MNEVVLGTVAFLIIILMMLFSDEVDIFRYILIGLAILIAISFISDTDDSCKGTIEACTELAP